jgi:hypothetical protein
LKSSITSRSTVSFQLPSILNYSSWNYLKIFNHSMHDVWSTGQECRRPFDYCDVVVSTICKNLRGPMVVQCSSRKGKKRETGWIFEYRINLVFSIQHKDPDDNHISDLAVTLSR